MSNIIDSIQLSGTVYTIQGSGGNNVVELTQAQYDALVDKNPTTFYIITDATAGDLTNYYTKTETNTLLGGKQATLVSGTNIKTINNESILGSGNIDIQGGGGKAIEAGRGISITTGETADTVSFNLPISAGTGTDALIMASDTYAISDKAKGSYSVSLNGGNLHPNYAKGSNSLAEGMDTKTYGTACHSEGYGTKAGVENNINIQYAHAEGDHTEAKGTASHAEGSYTIANNWVEHASGRYNNSVSASTTFGNSGNTLFSVGNGTANNARHNAFEIRQNGDIYLSLNGQDVKLQDQLGGSDINVVQTTGTSTTDVMSQNAVTTQLSGYVTTKTRQEITGNKTFIGSINTNEKPIIFKQANDNHKIGFVCRNTASINNELATFELRPNTFTIDNVQHPLLYFGHYRNTQTANAGVPQTVIGFRQYDEYNGAAYHYLIPLPEKAKTPFSLTTSFKDYYAPMGFKNGSTMITADNTGVVDLSSELGGLKLKKLTQAQYDALSPNYDSNTLYVIVN